jgi:hypothetical protein
MAEQYNAEDLVQTFSKESKRLLNFIKQRVPTNEDAEDILQGRDVTSLRIRFRVMKPVEQVGISGSSPVARDDLLADSCSKNARSCWRTKTFGYKDDGDTLSLADMLPSHDGSAEGKMMNDPDHEDHHRVAAETA